MNLRTTATRIMLQVIKGHSLNDVLPDALTKYSDMRDQRLIQAISYGVCRWYDRLNEFLKFLLTKPLKDKDQDIHCLLLVGLYQLLEMRIPDHAVVAETVAAVRDFKKIWAKNLVNAVLRNFIRQKSELEKTLSKNIAATYSHPEWMIEKIKTSWPNDWHAILNANNQHPPFSLRVNQCHFTRDDYILRLSAGMSAEIIPFTHTGITLAEPVDVKQLPGFEVGDITVQDGAAQLAAELLEVTPTHRILDACAAPGGKTTHILEIISAASQKLKISQQYPLIAIDSDAGRLQKVQENMLRLKLSANCIAADASDIQSWWDGNLFDRILLDAPCSASGVIRRHPDIKLLRRVTDIAKLVDMQLRLLEALWQVLIPGGLLVYATCSVFPDENTGVLETFLANHPDVTEGKIAAGWGKECTVGRQILPGMHGMDGFYFARLRKPS
jgi:16S rRNA (cytosine967-C5)-methyltransferase